MASKKMWNRVELGKMLDLARVENATLYVPDGTRFDRNEPLAAAAITVRRRTGVRRRKKKILIM